MTQGIVYAPGSAPAVVVSAIAGLQTAEYVYTVPAGVIQRLLAMFFTYAAGATAGNRLLGYQIQGQDGATTVVGAQTFPLTTLNVVSTAGFPTGGNVSVAGLAGSVRYAGVTPTSFTGITNGSGTAADGAAVTEAAPYIWLARFPVAITANQTANVSISPRAPNFTQANTAQAMTLHAPNVWLWPGSTIATSTSSGAGAGFLAGDQYTAVNLYLEQIPSTGYTFP